jgi:hypothetical protein
VGNRHDDRLAPARGGPHPSSLVVSCQILASRLTGAAINQRHHDGAAIVTRPAEGAVPDGYDRLFLIRLDGQPVAVAKHRRPAPEDGDTLVLLGPAAQAANASSAPSG